MTSQILLCTQIYAFHWQQEWTLHYIILLCTQIYAYNWQQEWTLHYTTLHVCSHFIDPSVCTVAVAVKHVMYHNLQLTNNHFIVAHRTHPLFNKSQINTFIKQSQTLYTAYDSFFTTQPLHFVLHTKLKIHQYNKKSVQSRGFLMIVQFVFYHPLNLQYILVKR